MQAVILAGGLGTRLRPFTEVIPKPLLPVGESSVLDIQILRLKKCGVTEVYIATNYKADFLAAFLGDGTRYGIKVFISRETMPLGTCGPLTLLKGRLTGPFIMMNGDILTTLDFHEVMEFATGVDADLTVVTKEIETPFNFGKVLAEGDYVVGVEEKPNFKLEVLAGIYVLKPPILSHIPENTLYGIDLLIKDMLFRREKVAKYLTTDYWLDIGSIQNYEIAQDAYRLHFAEMDDQPIQDASRREAA